MTDALATTPVAATKVPDLTRAPARELKARMEPKFEARPEPKFDVKVEPRTEPAATPGKKSLRKSRRGDGQLAGPSARKDVIATSDRRVRLVTVVVGVAGLILFATAPAAAQDISVNFGQGNGLTERVIQMIALLTVLSLAPSILVMMTSFTRIVVVLSLLRTALGTATAPPNAVIVSLALFLTAFVMGPALQRAYDTGIRPLMANEITAEQAFERGAQPLRAFMQKNVREKDLQAVC